MNEPIKASGNENVEIARDAHGTPHVRAETDADLYWGMGYCHALDRGLQMLLMRILGRGELCKHLDASDASLQIDQFFRRMNWAGHLDEPLAELDDDTRRRCEAYCAGVNARFERKLPWELKLAGYSGHDPWSVGDSVLLSRMVGYLTLAQSQGEIERLLVEMVQAGVPTDALEELFPGHLSRLDPELLQKVTLGERIVPEAVRWGVALPRMMASNNWVVSGSRTASGKPLLANDPHLEVNRLPNIWYEIALHQGERYAIAATMPGLPAPLVGRTADLAWGATYTFMDATDSWVEHCKDGCFRRGDDEWVPFRARKETIHRKKKAPVEAVFYENDHGVLDGDPFVEGYYLATRWASARSGGRSVAAIQALWDAETVTEGMALLGSLETTWNWVLADRSGNIGYQMSGMMPRRREGVSGLVPLPGWDPDNDWQGVVSQEELPSVLNPDSGYFVTANQDLNAHGAVSPINMPMGAYRAQRISELLEASASMDVDGTIEIQHDLTSPQAALFMEVLRPLLPDSDAGRLLAEWDCRYDPESRGASLFEDVYAALLSDIFGTKGVGEPVARYLARETGIFGDFYANFDAILLSETSAWFGGETRDAIFERVAKQTLEQAAGQPWGARQQVPLSHILFGGKLPRWLGFDRGPITIPGGRATPHQGQIYRSAGRLTSFVPSFRFIADMSTDELRSNLLGGPSDRRFSKWYVSDVENWQTRRYKVTSGR